MSNNTLLITLNQNTYAIQRSEGRSLPHRNLLEQVTLRCWFGSHARLPLQHSNRKIAHRHARRQQVVLHSQFIRQRWRVNPGIKTIPGPDQQWKIKLMFNIHNLNEYCCHHVWKSTNLSVPFHSPRKRGQSRFINSNKHERRQNVLTTEIYNAVVTRGANTTEKLWVSQHHKEISSVHRH